MLTLHKSKPLVFWSKAGIGQSDKICVEETQTILMPTLDFVVMCFSFAAILMCFKCYTVFLLLHDFME